MGSMSIIVALLVLCALQVSTASVPAVPSQNSRTLQTSIVEAKDSLVQLDMNIASSLMMAETMFVSNLNTYSVANSLFEIIKLFTTFKVPTANITALQIELDSAMNDVTVKMTEQFLLARLMRSVALSTWHHLDTDLLSIRNDQTLIRDTEFELLRELGNAEQLAKDFSQTSEASINAITVTLSSMEQSQVNMYVDNIRMTLSMELSSLENARFAFADASFNAVQALDNVIAYLP